MNKNGFTSFSEIADTLNNRSIIFFGAGSVAIKTKKKLNNYKLAFIFDNNPNYWNAKSMNLKVLNPSKLKSKEYNKRKYLIIICTTSFRSVSDQLIKLGLKSNTDFVISPIMNDLRIIDKIEKLEKKMLFTSGLPAEKSKNFGGGIYELILNKNKWGYKKVLSGTCYGVIKNKNNYIAVDDKLGLIKMNKNYEIIDSSDFEIGTRAHGIAYSEAYEEYYVVASLLDQILIFNKKFKLIDRISLSDKYKYTLEPHHHCNDICIVNNSIYVSMFSYSGNFKNDIFDGVVLEIDIKSRKILRPVISDLWMPHNISFFEGSLTVLDSLRGSLRNNNAQEIGIFPGFTRGLDFDGSLYFIGQSRNRNFSKTFGTSKNISIDTSIIIFDPETKVSKSIFLPSNLSEIHSVLLI